MAESSGCLNKEESYAMTFGAILLIWLFNFLQAQTEQDKAYETGVAVGKYCVGPAVFCGGPIILILLVLFFYKRSKNKTPNQ